MMKMETISPSATGVEATKAFASGREWPVNGPAAWEVRPCGMLVQKRGSEDGVAAVPVPVIRVRVKHESSFHEMCISSQATFGELKKLLAGRTGLHPQDQKILFKDKERESAAFLDLAGVKDRSKLIVVKDPTAQAKRFVEMRRAVKVEKAAKSISEVSLQVDKLASQVSELEAIVLKGGKVAEREVLNLIELLMNLLLKLDGIIADGDVKLERKFQVRRVQKYVEALDVLKNKNSMPSADNHRQSHRPPQHQQKQQTNQSPALPRPMPSVIVTTKWETFDSLFSPAPSAPTSAAATAASSEAPTPRFDWELF
ncbi:BAG family molecular chaperone regulator 3 [Apostasia shenzhenica]|uniref:BAG family molecular chaperone regulator 3 n=1 Tax=Apostasia shenzhenica TaxID=1088818 RepID=A0A2I0B1H1_9ASPA|nr:BAG family molecular chaperone regulator 3 [Apostasia shenzhenica]